jgi:hypothetical protein
MYRVLFSAPAKYDVKIRVTARRDKLQNLAYVGDALIVVVSGTETAWAELGPWPSPWFQGRREQGANLLLIHNTS